MANIGKPKVRAPRKPVAAGDTVQIKTLIKHPMESGLRKDTQTGQPIPAHHISEVVVKYLDKEILKSQWTGSISKNPFFAFFVKATAAGPVEVVWRDNQGGEYTASTQLKVA